MKRFIWTCAIIALITSCKTQRVVPLVIRDSVSVTYHPGAVQSLTRPAGYSADFTDSAPTCGGAIKKEQIPQKVRVDTLIVERWHTEVCQPKAVCQRSGPSGEAGLSAKRSQFYKNCTWCFWILLILFLGGFALRIMKAIYLRK